MRTRSVLVLLATVLAFAGFGEKEGYSVRNNSGAEN